MRDPTPIASPSELEANSKYVNLLNIRRCLWVNCLVKSMYSVQCQTVARASGMTAEIQRNPHYTKRCRKCMPQGPSSVARTKPHLDKLVLQGDASCARACKYCNNTSPTISL